MTGPEWLELMLSAYPLVRRASAPWPPWWGRGLRRLLARAFWIVGRSVFDVRVDGLERFQNRPATIIVANHRTDFDIVLLSPTLYLAHRGRGPVSRLAFVASDRMFEPGYLATEIVRRPHWLSRALFRLDLSDVLTALRAHPIPPAQRRPLRSYLHDILQHEGNARLSEILDLPRDEQSAGLLVEPTIRDALRWRHREALRARCDLAAFPRSVAKRLRERQVRAIVDGLARFAAILDDGDSLFLAPEGELSSNGAFGEIRAGLCRLIRTAERKLTILPVLFTYDFMASGRPPVFLTIGRELRGIEDWTHRRVEQTVERAITELGTVTLTQLVSDALYRAERSGKDGLGEADLKAGIRTRVGGLARAGVRVDERLCDAVRFERRWRRFVRYARRQGILRRRDGRLELVPGATAKPPGLLTPPDSPWEYGANELASLLEAVWPSKDRACRSDD